MCNWCPTSANYTNWQKHIYHSIIILVRLWGIFESSGEWTFALVMAMLAKVVSHFTPVWPMLWTILHPCDQCGEPLYTSMTSVVNHFTPMWPVWWTTLHQRDQCGEPLYTSVTNVVNHFTPAWPMWWTTLHQRDQCGEPLYTSMTSVVNHFTPMWPVWWTTLHQRDQCGEPLYTSVTNVVNHFTPAWPMWWTTLHQRDQCGEPLYTSVTNVVNHFTPDWSGIYVANETCGSGWGDGGLLTAALTHRIWRPLDPVKGRPVSAQRGGLGRYVGQIGGRWPAPPQRAALCHGMS